MNLVELRFKLIAAFIVLAALPLAGFGVAAYYKGVEMTREKAISHLKSVVDMQAKMIENFISERNGDMNLLAKTVFNQSTVEPGGGLLDRLNVMQEEYRVYKNIMMAGPGGTMILAGGNENLKDRDVTDREWYRQGMEGRPFTSDIFPDSDGRLAILVSVPLQQFGREIRGVLASVVDFQNIADSLTGMSIGRTGEFYLVDKDGRLLTGTRLGSGRIGQKIHLENTGDSSGQIEIKEYIDYRGKKVLRVIEGLRELGWIIVAEQDSEEAFAEINSLRRAVSGVVVILILLTALTAWLLSNRIVGLLERADSEKKELEMQVIQKDKLASMGFLTAGIAHELNTPLASALLYAQMLKEDTRESWPEHTESLDSVIEEIERGSNIVRNLLAFSRQSRISSTVTDVNEILLRLLEIARKLCSERGIVVTCSLEEGLPFVNGDGAVLHQVFMNMVANAVEVMDNGGVLEITTRYVPVLNKVKVEIQDTGPGIPKDYIDKVFDPFFTTKRPGEGTGLGLAISYGMVRKMGGQIRVISICNQDRQKESGPTGTTFVIELPVPDKTETDKD
jgi:two-component system NtrC family sensor kinase